MDIMLSHNAHMNISGCKWNFDLYTDLRVSSA